MKANELRLGNKLFFCNRSHTIMGIGANLLFIENDFKHTIGPYELEDFEPIPIDENWLKKYGFNKIEDTHRKIIGKEDLCVYEMWLVDPCNDAGYSVQYYEVFDQLQNTEDYRFVSIEKEVKYIHELQNLYFVLTGRELELVNPEKKY